MTRLALIALLALASGAGPAKASRCYWSICHCNIGSIPRGTSSVSVLANRASRCAGSARLSPQPVDHGYQMSEAGFRRVPSAEPGATRPTRRLSVAGRKSLRAR